MDTSPDTSDTGRGLPTIPPYRPPDQARAALHVVIDRLTDEALLALWGLVHLWIWGQDKGV
jgi:hypothetical protein